MDYDEDGDFDLVVTCLTNLTMVRIFLKMQRVM